ncbi:Adaptive-response sensory-kinase SasA [Paenibacillus allorhizosphaerae]|uniref:histidine kinase n=1 Tax=Paenibacillus allorhizosphaerae TaxID=2849866 RepID=A0ABN7TMR2_9BACL|nr:Adaptive-response sensory-kinase SasA [Paenibacillus allorhizosphaerae]
MKVPKVRKPILERFPFTWFPFNLLRSLLLFIQDLYYMARAQVERSIRLQLMITFALCLLVSMFFYGISSSLFGQINKETVIDYTHGVNRIDNEARNLVEILDPDNQRYEIDEPEAQEQSEMQSGLPFVQQQTRSTSAAAARPASTEPKAGEAGQGDGSVPWQANAGTPGQPSSGTQQTVPGTGGAAVAPKAPQSGSSNSEAEQRKRQQQEERKRDFLNLVKRLSTNEKYKIVITDLEGRVIFRSDNAPETYVDVHNVIRNAMESRDLSSRTEFSSFYPVTYNNQKSYLIVSGIPQPDISYTKGESPLSYLSALAVFIFLFYYLTQKKMRYVEELASSLRIIATGNLDYRVVERSQDELGSLAKNMNMMVEDLQHKIEEERRAERVKNELITNVSHDLRTPLTLIMGYLRLLHDKNYETPEQAASYASVAYNKSEKLKLLIDDLFEYTKLSNHDVPMYKRGVVINEVLEQLLEEYVTIGEEQQLTIIRSIPHERYTVLIDVDKMIRVFENLLSNAVKYSPKPGTISVGMARDRGHVVIRISNKADALTREELEQLFDRFYRVDTARTSETGGSGLGLAIARSIMESHEGTIWAESENGEIHLYVKLKLVS